MPIYIFLEHFVVGANLLFRSKCPSEITSVMNNKLKLLTHWLIAKKLSLNESN